MPHRFSENQIFRQTSTPANGDSPEGALAVGDGWYDTGGTPAHRRCTSISPITFVSAEHNEAHAFTDTAIHTGTFITEAFISASALKGTTTAGAGDSNKLPESAELATNLVNYDYMAFDTTTEENAFFHYKLPVGWNEGTITFRFVWTNTGGLTTETVVFGLKALALGDDDAIDAAWGTEVTVTDTWLARNDIHISAESGAVTIGGTPVEGDIVMFNIARKTASDNLSGDARLLGIVLRFTRNAITD